MTSMGSGCVPILSMGTLSDLHSNISGLFSSGASVSIVNTSNMNASHNVVLFSPLLDRCCSVLLGLRTKAILHQYVCLRVLSPNIRCPIPVKRQIHMLNGFN